MKRIVAFIVIGLIVLLAACGNDNEETSNNTTTNPEDITLEKDEMVEEDKVVLEINDSEVLGERYNTVYLQTKIRAYQFGQDIEDKDAIKEITLNEIIAQELLKQEAERQEITVSDEEVQEEFEELKSQDEESFQAYLDRFKLTEESLKEQIRFTQTLNQYMEQEITVEQVTEEDIKETYEQLKQEMDDIMEFEDAEPIIQEQLTMQREADALQLKVEELMDESDIKKNI